MVLLVMLCLAHWSVAEPLSHLQGMQNITYHAMKSAHTDSTYHIYVSSPSVSKDTQLPVVYLLDGGNTFPMLASYAKYMMFSEEIPPLILVGISYGTDEFKQGNFRSRDFTLASAERSYYGGAPQFHRFLTTELMPWVAQQHAIDDDKKILFGHSIAGQFVLYNAMFQPQTFSGLIASNPAIHRNVEAFIAPLPTTQAKPKLVLMQAEQDDEQFQTPRTQWLDHWHNKPHHWQLKIMQANGHNHMSSVPSAFRQGLLWLFNQPQTSNEIKQP